MTLNTFHFAGHGAANVTLGIPRLREIVMTASQNIRTPTMQLPILSDVTDSDLKSFCQSSTRLTLSQIIDEVTVQERLSPKSEKNGYSRRKLYTVRLAFFPSPDYISEYSINSEQILAGIQRTFVPLLDKAITREIKLNDKELRGQAGDMIRAQRNTAVNAATGRDDPDEAEDSIPVGREDGEEIDGDADDYRRRKQGKDDADYDDDEAEDQDDGGVDAAFNESDGDSSDGDEDEAAGAKKVTAKQVKLDKAARMKAVERRTAGTSKFIDTLRFDIENGEWCEFDLEVSF